MSQDPLGAFCPHVSLSLPGRRGGPLSGRTFAAKDNFAVAGYRTGAGNPDWLRTHEPETRTAPALKVLLEAGATLIAKTNMDELAFSLDGVNVHYGTPINPRVPDRIPGGSSSGSASAVAGGLVDFAMGTDTAGSVRVPASLCGLFGIRPTHGRISIDGIVPFAPSYDTVGWFARSADLLRQVGEVLLPTDGDIRTQPRRLLIADDAFAAADDAVRHALGGSVQTVTRLVGSARPIQLAPAGFDAWVGVFGTLRGAEACAALGDWIAATNPHFGPGIRDRFELTRTITPPMVAKDQAERGRIVAHLDALLGTDGVICLPTVPVLPPLRNATAAELGEYRARTLRLTITATIGGLPQVSLPLAEVHGVSIGLSLIGPRGGDRGLLRLAEEIALR